MEIEHHTELTDRDATAVVDLADGVADADGVEAISEDTLLTLRRPGRPRYLVRSGPDLIAAAQVSDGSAELAVDPGYRRRGIGTDLLRTVVSQHPTVRLWAHGNLPAAAAIARQQDLANVRELWHMARPAPDSDSKGAADGEIKVPADLTISAFQPGQDEQTWLDINARAFADHPEQGALDRNDLDARMAQEWFDPSTFWIARDAATARPLGSMWVKVTSEDGSRTGEIYALGVDPDAQGRGIGSVLTQVAMAYFASAKLDTLELYVEGENTPAIRTYKRAGFAQASVHVQYQAREPLSTE